MESEKVKEIKKALEDCASNEIANKLPYIDDHKCKAVAFADILTLINELESENEKLAKAGKRVTEINEELSNEHKKIEEQLKDRIVELEEALLDMVVQFCQMGEEGYLKHIFMSAEEQAFETLEIQYGEKVSDVYKRFFKRWGREYEE